MPRSRTLAEEAAIAEAHRSFESQLPHWRLVPTPRGTGLICPTCGGKAVVNLAEWKDSSDRKGRPCTYCMRTNRIPENA